MNEMAAACRETPLGKSDELPIPSDLSPIRYFISATFNDTILLARPRARGQPVC
jgi:hypothetical protein